MQSQSSEILDGIAHQCQFLLLKSLWKTFLREVRFRRSFHLGSRKNATWPPPLSKDRSVAGSHSNPDSPCSKTTEIEFLGEINFWCFFDLTSRGGSHDPLGSGPRPIPAQIPVPHVRKTLETVFQAKRIFDVFFDLENGGGYMTPLEAVWDRFSLESVFSMSKNHWNQVFGEN